MSEQGYNGWTNWETWVVNLWYGDLLYDDMREMLADNPDLTVMDFEDIFHEIVMSVEYDRLPKDGLAREFFDGAMSSVNWYELADANYDDICDELEIDRSE